MNEYNLSQAKEYFQTLEDSIENLPVEEQASIYRPCAINCVKNTVLKEHQKQFQECHKKEKTPSYASFL